MGKVSSLQCAVYSVRLQHAAVPILRALTTQGRSQDSRWSRFACQYE
jgi:hypothetical protein